MVVKKIENKQNNNRLNQTILKNIMSLQNVGDHNFFNMCELP